MAPPIRVNPRERRGQVITPHRLFPKRPVRETWTAAHRLTSPPVIQHADVVVIGSGGLGAATAFSLARDGSRPVALLARHELASQTSPRAAGLISHARSTDLRSSWYGSP